MDYGVGLVGGGELEVVVVSEVSDSFKISSFLICSSSHNASASSSALSSMMSSISMSDIPEKLNFPIIPPVPGASDYGQSILINNIPAAVTHV